MRLWLADCALGLGWVDKGERLLGRREADTEIELYTMNE